MEKLTLPFGCNRAIAAQARRPRVAWGARLIAPADLLWDRQGCAGGEEGGPERTALLEWLSAGAGEAARERARELRLGVGDHELDGRSQAMVSLYVDERGEVMGSPQGSHGYVYIAAWLFEHCAPAPEHVQAVREGRRQHGPAEEGERWWYGAAEHDGRRNPADRSAAAERTAEPAGDECRSGVRNYPRAS